MRSRLVVVLAWLSPNERDNPHLLVKKLIDYQEKFRRGSN